METQTKEKGPTNEAAETLATVEGNLNRARERAESIDGEVAKIEKTIADKVGKAAAGAGVYPQGERDADETRIRELREEQRQARQDVDTIAGTLEEHRKAVSRECAENIFFYRLPPLAQEAEELKAEYLKAEAAWKHAIEKLSQVMVRFNREHRTYAAHCDKAGIAHGSGSPLGTVRFPRVRTDGVSVLLKRAQTGDDVQL